MKPITTIVAVAVVLGGGAFLWSHFRAAGASQPTRYRLAPVSRMDVRKTVSASGTLQPWTTVDVKSKAGGRIDLLAVDVGSIVRKDQIVARIDPSDSQLTYSQAQADTESAQAKQGQSVQTYQLQIKQSSVAIEQARANLDSAKAAARQAAARYQTALSESTAQPALTNASINQAKAAYESAKKDRVRLDATQAQDRASAQSTYDQAVANDKNAQATLTRQRSLLDKGFVSEQSVDTLVASAEVTRAQVASAKARLDTLSAEQKASRDASDAQVAQALAQLQSSQTQSITIGNKRNSLAESHGALLQAQAQVEVAQASLSEAIADQRNNDIRKLDIASSAAGTARAKASLINAKSTLDQTTVRAPSEGVVLQKYVEQGTIITSGLSMNSTGTSIVQIGDISRMYVDVSVDETDIANVHTSQPVDVSFDAYPSIQFKGKVSKVAPQAVVESNVTTVHVRVEVDNRNPDFSKLKPAMNATCDFVVGDAPQTLAVPAEAMHTESGGDYVLVATGGKPSKDDATAIVGAKIEKRTVKIGIEGTDATQIVSGVSEGEQVVTETIASTAAATDSASSDDSTQKKAAFGGGGPGGGGPPGPPPGGK